jgi:hypothetical protein
MTTQGKFKDNTPFIKVSGITTATGLTTDQSLRQDLYFKPSSTPESIKKYRKSVREIPGKKQLHYGVYNDPKDHENMVHGLKTFASDHVTDCIKGNNITGINYFINNIHEQKYAKNQREPLGKSLIRNYEFPEKAKEDGFRFGIPTTGCKIFY